MSTVSKILIPDTSCLILLHKIDELPLLKRLAGEVIVTPTVEKEFKGNLTGWFELAEPDNNTYHTILQEGIDKGEASVIALSLKLAESVVVVDDLKGRTVAGKIGITYTGTFGLILKARQLGIIDNVRPILNKIQATNFRFDPSILKVVLKYSGD